MKPITVWVRFDKDAKKWSHNHIEDGHMGNKQLKPIGSKAQTANWSKGMWMYEHKYLDNNKVV